MSGYLKRKCADCGKETNQRSGEAKRGEPAYCAEHTFTRGQEQTRQAWADHELGFIQRVIATLVHLGHLQPDLEPDELVEQVRREWHP